MTLNDLENIFNLLKYSNFISIGPYWKFDLWPINFDLWGQIYTRSTVHWMFYQITYDGPACFSRCSDIAKYANLTSFLQAPEMALNELGPQISVNPGNTGQWCFHMCIFLSMCCIARGRYEFLKIFRLRPCIWPLWPQMTSDKKWSNNICRGAQALSYTQVTWSCYAICRSSDFSEKTFLTSVTLDDLWPDQGSHDICGLGHWLLWPNFIEIDQSSL